MYNYSIIVPHHNNPELLDRCLSSIPIREDLQVIVSDDNSNIESKNQLRLLARLYPKVEFLYSDVTGYGGKARNIGLERALGKYIMFIDDDDYFNPCIKQVLEEYKEETTDIVFFNAIAIDADDYTPTWRADHLNYMHHLYQSNPKQAEFLLRYSFGEPWCKLVRKELIDEYQIRFEETIIHNDTQFSYLIGYYAKSIKVDPRVIYNYTIRKNSVSVSFSDERYLRRVEVFSKKNQYLSNHGISFFDTHLLSSFIHYLDTKNTEKLRECYTITNKYGISDKTIKRLIMKARLKSYFKNVIKIYKFIRNVRKANAIYG